MTTIKLRRGTAAQWTSANSVLAQGEPGYETDTDRLKIGDGSSTWSALDYYIPQSQMKAAFGALRQTAATVTANATLAGDVHTPVDATSGAITLTLPAPTRAGQVIVVEKVDSTTNVVTVSGTIRGAAGTISLVGQYEAIMLISESTSSWRPEANHRTKTWMDASYAAAKAVSGTTPVPLASNAYGPLATPILTNFRKKLALTRLGQSPTRVLCLGDSTTAGVFSDSYTTATGSTNQGGPNSYPAQLANRLNAAGVPTFYNLAIPGHANNLDSRWSVGSWVYQALGPGMNACLSTSAAGSITLTPGVKADTYKIYFAANSGTGTMTAQATGGAVSAAFGTNATAGAYSITVTAASASASNTVTISWASGTVFVTGVEWSDSTNPNRLAIGNAGVGSSKATDWANSPTYYAKALTWVKTYAPDLTIISLGLNDIGANDTAADVLAAISTIITTAEASGDVLLMSAIPHQTSTALDTVNESLRTASGVPSRPYVDLFQRYGHNMLAQGFKTVDDTHPNAIGYADIASAIGGLLLSL